MSRQDELKPLGDFLILYFCCGGVVIRALCLASGSGTIPRRGSIIIFWSVRLCWSTQPSKKWLLDHFQWGERALGVWWLTLCGTDSIPGNLWGFIYQRWKKCPNLQTAWQQLWQVAIAVVRQSIGQDFLFDLWQINIQLYHGSNLSPIICETGILTPQSFTPSTVKNLATVVVQSQVPGHDMMVI